jgi:hypothetical protein
LEHTPVVGLHEPTPWHASLAVQTTEPPAVQTALWQVSFKSQRLPSLHVVPSGAAGFEQVPVVGLHVPATWHWSLGVHVTGLVPTHAPDSHAPPPKQRLPVPHELPLVTGTCEHVPFVLQVSTTQGLFVSHDAGVHVGPPPPPVSTATSAATSAATASCPPPPPEEDESPPASVEAASGDASTEAS